MKLSIVCIRTYLKKMSPLNRPNLNELIIDTIENWNLNLENN